MSNNVADLEQARARRDTGKEKLTAERVGVLSASPERNKTNEVLIDGQRVEFAVTALNDSGKVMLEATRKLLEQHKDEVVKRLHDEMPDLSEEEIFDIAHEEVEQAKKELSSLPGLMNFLNGNNDQIQEISKNGGCSVNNRSESVEGYLGAKGIPLGAEHYFLTTIKDKNELAQKLQTSQLSGAHQLTVREFYTSSISDGFKQRLGFKVFEAGKEDKPEMVFIFAEEVSEPAAEPAPQVDSSPLPDQRQAVSAESLAQGTVANDNEEEVAKLDKVA